jgi:hypothetical protein
MIHTFPNSPPSLGRQIAVALVLAMQSRSGETLEELVPRKIAFSEDFVDAIRWLRAEGMIGQFDEIPTDRCRAWVRDICRVPLPRTST